MPDPDRSPDTRYIAWKGHNTFQYENKLLGHNKLLGVSFFIPAELIKYIIQDQLGIAFQFNYNEVIKF
jgi:hypothetical protein